MTDNWTPPPGWYPAPHANGEQRYWDGSAWSESAPPAATVATAVAEPPAPKRKGLRWWAWLLIGLGALIVLIIIIGSINAAGNGRDEDDAVPAVTEPASAEPVEEVTEEPAPAEPAVPEMTVSQENAVSKAESYLQFSAFSRTGLIQQLEFEGFPTADAEFAVDYLQVDWNAQAAAKAQQYLDSSAFSRDSLIEQLLFEGFSQAEAEYGVGQVGL